MEKMFFPCPLLFFRMPTDWTRKWRNHDQLPKLYWSSTRVHNVWSWKDLIAHASDRSLIEPTACEGSLGRLSLAKYAGGFVNPNDSTARKNMTLQVTNDFTNWRPLIRLSSITSEGYSAIAGYGGKNYALIEQNNKIVLFDLNPYVR